MYQISQNKNSRQENHRNSNIKTYLVIPNFPYSENGRLRRDGSTLPSQHKNLQNGMFQVHPAKTRFLVKHSYLVLGSKD